MLRPSRDRISLVVALALCASGCKFVNDTVSKITRKPSGPPPAVPKPLMVRSFSDATAATSVLGVGDVLWVGTARGLLRWDMAKGTSTRLTAQQGLPGNRVHALAADSAGALWVATAGGIVHQLKGGSKTYP